MKIDDKKVFKRGIKTFYRGISLRSRWEIFVTKLFMYSDINFMYEPQRFQLTPNLSYIPDFYVPQYNKWVEVKGSLSTKDVVKMKIFSHSYNLKYLGKEELRIITGKKSLGFLSSPSIVDYIPSKDEIERFKKFLAD